MRLFVLTCCCLLLCSVASAQTTVTSLPYATPNRGGFAVETAGTSTAPLQVGYAQMQPSASTAPSGSAVIGFSVNDVLVSETGVPAGLPMLSGRTFAEVNGSVNTGIAFANPSSVQVLITVTLTNQSGLDYIQRTFTLGANAQIAAFLHEAPFNVTGTVLGTFTFTANAPVAVVALRGLTNSRNEFLISTQPVTPLPASFNADVTIMPHFADGPGWRTQVILVNPSDEMLTGTVQFFSGGTDTVAATPIFLNVDGLAANSFNYVIQPRSFARLRTGGTSSTILTGNVRVAPTGGTRSPSALAVFSFSNGGIVVTEAAVPALRPSIAWRAFVESTSSGNINTVQTGLAIANTSLTTATISAELTTLDGVAIVPSVFFTVPGNGHRALFFSQLFPNQPLPFSGILRLTSGTTQTVITSLRSRYNQRGDFLISNVPPASETTQSTTADFFFPHIADGGGYTTQFLLFSGVFSQSTTGILRFLTKTGSPMSVVIE